MFFTSGMGPDRQPGRRHLDPHPEAVDAQTKLVEQVQRKERKGYRRIA